MSRARFDESTAFYFGFILLMASGVVATPTQAQDGSNVVASSPVTLPPDCKAALTFSTTALRSSKIEFTRKIQRPIRDAKPEAERKGKIFNRERALCEQGDGRFHFKYERFFADYEVRPAFVEEMTYDGNTFYKGSPPRKSENGKTASGRGRMFKFLGENPEDPLAERIQVNVAYLDAIGFPAPLTAADFRHAQVDSILLAAEKNGGVRAAKLEKGLLVLEFECPCPALLAARRVDLDQLAKAQRFPRHKERDDESESDGRATQLEAIEKMRARPPIRKVKMSLDPTKNYAVVTQEQRTADGDLIQTYECDDFQFFPGASIWLPKSCTMRYYDNSRFFDNFSDDPVRIEVTKLEDASFEGDPVQAPDYGRETVIADRSTIEAKETGRGELTYVKAPTAAETKADAERLAKGNPVLRTVLIVNCIALAILASIYFYRRRAAL